MDGSFVSSERKSLYESNFIKYDDAIEVKKRNKKEESLKISKYDPFEEREHNQIRERRRNKYEVNLYELYVFPPSIRKNLSRKIWTAVPDSDPVQSHPPQSELLMGI